MLMPYCLPVYKVNCRQLTVVKTFLWPSQLSLNLLVLVIEFECSVWDQLYYSIRFHIHAPVLQSPPKLSLSLATSNPAGNVSPQSSEEGRLKRITVLIIINSRMKDNKVCVISVGKRKWSKRKKKKNNFLAGYSRENI